MTDEEKKERRLAYSRAYYLANLEKLRAYKNAYQKAYRKTHPGYDKAYDRAYKASHKEQSRQSRQVWLIANSDQQKAYRKAYHKRTYKQNAEVIKARVKAYADSNKAVIRDRNKAFREKNQEKLRARARAYYLAHRAELIAYQRVRATAKANIIRPYKQAWLRADRKRHPEKYRSTKAARRARELGTYVDKIDYAAILKKANGLCGICHKPFDLFGVEFDHIVPLSKGGPHVASNLQATHARCNRAKGAKVS